MNNHEKSPLSQKLDKHASKVYLHDSTGENYIENVVHLTHLPKIVAEIGSDWSNKSILEMGFGEGVISRALVGQGMKFELLEGSEELVTHAKTLYGNKLEVHDSLFEDFSPPRFDSVLALHILEHVDDPKTIVKKCIHG
jgi:2-polyprenyl-3-methyl-5-hydroxy-6-metoxy-1,4-benzoquinol methylase